MQPVDHMGKAHSSHSSPWIHELDEIPGIRQKKVQALRQALAQGTWNPDPVVIAEKMLREYLCYPLL
jgi:anti-sigma28 factor (negative regulator of flagellin synthesis)